MTRTRRRKGVHYADTGRAVGRAVITGRDGLGHHDAGAVTGVGLVVPPGIVPIVMGTGSV